MRITYDRDANAVYVYLTDEALPPGRKSALLDTPKEVTDFRWVAMDWRDGKIVGLEVLYARETLHQDLLDQAEIIG